MEQRCGGRGESYNAEPGIQDQHGDIDTCQQGAKIVRQCRQRVLRFRSSVPSALIS